MTTQTRDLALDLGVALKCRDLGELVGDPAALCRLSQDLDRDLVVRIVSETLPTATALAALGSHLGRPRPLPAAIAVEGCEIIGDFSAKARLDDGRERKPTFIEGLHYDVLEDGLAAYGVQHTRVAPPTAPMQWVDMRRVYADLTSAMKARIAPLHSMLYPRVAMDAPRSSGTPHPLVMHHPRTGEPLLWLPNQRDARVVELPEAEGRALISELWGLVEASPARLSHAMRSGEIYVWDNIAAVHNNPVFPRAADRTIWFFNVPAEVAA